MIPQAEDEAHMRAALSLARRGLGTTWPNPSVGCVLVQDGRVLARARTAPGGRPHAEALALQAAGRAARGATAYVTLEPCAHHGQTPPCAEALAQAGIARVVIATADPDPRVDGKGVQALHRAGVDVVTGLLANEGTDVHRGFLTRVREGRPMVTLKLATTLDGRIALKSGSSRWITGQAARRAAHALRGRHDAVMVGVGTAMADDPDLTCRIPGFRTVPLVRIVLDTHLRLRLTCRLIATAGQAPTWVVHGPHADPARAEALRNAGVRLLTVTAGETGVDAAAALQALGQAGLTRVLVEGGAQLAASLMRADLVDEVAWFHAPAVMGGDGWAAAAPFGLQDLDGMPRFTRVRSRALGADMLTELRRPI